MIGELASNDSFCFSDALKQNTQNQRSLTAAYELDKSIMEFSQRFISNKVSSCVSAPFIESEKSLEQVMLALKEEVLDRLYLHEYFLVNVSGTVKKFEGFIKGTT